MTFKTFWTQLFYSTALAMILGIGINYFLGDAGEWGILIASVCLFVVMSIVVYYAGQAALKSGSPYSFIRLIIVNVFAKIVICFAMVAIYFKVCQPESKLFILPFLTTYLIFMVFETYFLSIQSKTKI